MSANVVCPVLPELLMYPDGVPEGAPLSPCCCTWPVMDGPSRSESSLANLKLNFGFRPMGSESASVVVYEGVRSYCTDARIAVRTDVGMFLLALPMADGRKTDDGVRMSWPDGRGITWSACGGKVPAFEYPADNHSKLLHYALAGPADNFELAAAVSRTILARELCLMCFIKAAVTRDDVEESELLRSLEFMRELSA